MFTVYGLSDPLEEVTWADIRYVGLSENVTSRFQQHLSCSDTSNEDKNDWIQSLLKADKMPVLYKIEEVKTQEEGRAREQYWIRYAMGQGAKILNRAITYTEEERIKVHYERAIRYAQVAEILAQGTFVKRSACWYPTSLLERYTKRTFSLLDSINMRFRTGDGRVVSVHDATDEDFDAFIQQYIPILDNGVKVWSLSFDRMDSINFALFRGKTLDFCAAPPEKATPARKAAKKSKVQSFRPDYKRISEDGVYLSQSEGLSIQLSIFEAIELADWLQVNRKLLEDLL